MKFSKFKFFFGNVKLSVISQVSRGMKKLLEVFCVFLCRGEYSCTSAV